MSSFYHCYTHRPSKKGYPTTALPTPVQDLKSALICIKKAALAVSDLSLKLQLKQVTNFLESDIAQKLKQGIIQYTSLKHPDKNSTNYPENYLESKICVCLPSYGRQQQSGAQNISIAVKKPATVYPIEDNIQCQTAKSLLLGKISQSAVSKELMESSMREPSQTQTHGDKQRDREKSGLDKENQRQEAFREEEWKISSSEGMSGFGKVLKWRSVVTRNALEQHDTNKRVCFASEDGKINNGSELARINSQKLQDENRQLRQALVEFISTLKPKQIKKNTINVPIEQLLAKVQKCCEQLNKESLSQSHEVSMRSLKEQEQSVCQQIEEHKKQLQKSESQKKHLQSEISKMGDELQKSRMECQRLREIASARAEEIKKYELLLFVKEEQLASLKVIVESQQKKSISSVPTSPSGRTYKKYFQHLENSFTAMNNFSSTN